MKSVTIFEERTQMGDRRWPPEQFSGDVLGFVAWGA